jgi:DNA-binding CsgD family transcriptional regulator
MPAPFVGRQAELALLGGKLAQARAGQPQVVLVRGPAGIGKTWLVDRFLGTVADVWVVRADGEESEAVLTYGVAEQLLRAGAVVASGVRAAPGANGIVGVDPLAVGAQLLDMLGQLQAKGPVALVVDDAQWADLPSLRALLFALRRLYADQVLALFTVRDEEGQPLPEGLQRLLASERGTILRLGGLGADDLWALAAAMGVGGFSLRAAEGLRAHTGGNPLHARALLEELPAEVWGSGFESLPAPRSFSIVVLGRLAGCSTAAQQLVIAAAVLGARCSLGVAARLAGVDDPLAALEEARKAGLLAELPRPGERRIGFSHPLVRAAVYHDLGPARRAALHAAAAGLVADQAVVLRHRVAAAPAEDAQLAVDLAGFAGREAARGAWTSAAAHLVTASRLSPTRSERERYLLQAISRMLFGGDRAQADAFAEEIAGFAGGPLRDTVLGHLATLRAQPREAERLLRSAWEQVDPATDRELAATIALRSAVHCTYRLRGQEAVDWSRRAIALAAPGDPMRSTAETDLGVGLAYAGRLSEGLAALQSALARVAATPGESGLPLKTARGWLRLVADDLAGARADLVEAAALALRLESFAVAAWAFALLARADYHAGAWDDAVVHAERGLAVAVESDNPWVRPLLRWAAVAVPAARGDLTVAEEQAALVAVPAGDSEQNIAAAGLARAQLAAARGDHQGVLRALSPLLAIMPRQGIDEPGFWPWQDLYADALVSLGRVEEADAVLQPHETLAAERGRRLMLARLARVRGRLEGARGSAEAAEAAFLGGLGQLAPLPTPLERALLELAYGELLRRTGRRRAAGDRLHSAQEELALLGAEPYLARCNRELAACGLAAAEAGGRDRARLTPQELSVARLAASGLSNREVAAELVVSVKTVEFHLRHAYHKLGISSRKQLATRLRQPGAP